MWWILIALLAGIPIALVSRFVLNQPMLTVGSAAIALIPLNTYMNRSTDHLAHRTGQKKAGFISVTLSNLPELIFIFLALQANLHMMVLGGIIGSISGTLLLVMGIAIIVGCHKHGTLPLNQHTSSLFINQFFLMAVILFLPSLFESHISANRQIPMSYLFGSMLFITYILFFFMSRSDERTEMIGEQSQQLKHHWSVLRSVSTLALTTAGSITMCKLITDDVEAVATASGISQAAIGFVIAPTLMNVSEHLIAVSAAYKRMTELSMALTVGSASQVGMVVAPCAVLFGYLIGNPFTLNFTGMPFGVLLISLIGTYLVLRDNRWTMSEGVMLLGLYLAMIIAFAFTQ